MRIFSSGKKLLGVLAVAATVTAAPGYVTSAWADWDPGDPNTKWVQMPDLNFGMDVLATNPKILADDFLCTFSGPITDIHIWGSWLNNNVGAITNLHVSFHGDIPAGAVQPWSMPGPVLWQTNFIPGQFTERFYTNANEAFYDPNINQIVGFDTQVYQYNMFIDPANAFTQQIGNIYWLDVTVMTTNGIFGWKTSLQHFNDDAVFDDLPQLPPNWRDMHYPPEHPYHGQSIDLAFALTTIPEPSAFLLVALGGLAVVALSRTRNGHR
jgi:hypothetical protein